MEGAGRSIRRIADDLGIARNTVSRYLNSPEAMRPKRRPRRDSGPPSRAVHFFFLPLPAPHGAELLMEGLRKARAGYNLDRRLRVYLAPKVLVVDEFGI